jgi:hypothetical protein
LRPQNCSLQGTGWAVLGALAGPPSKLRPSSRTGAPKMLAPIFAKMFENHQFIDILEELDGLHQI